MVFKVVMVLVLCTTSVLCLSLQHTLTKQKFHQAGKQGTMVFIDVENTRGKSGFKLTHVDVINSVSIWAKAYDLDGCISLIVDHGSITGGYWLRNKGLSVIFAGQQMKADDVIARDVPFCLSKMLRDLIVVTADSELIQRCKGAVDRSCGKQLQIIPPHFFLKDLETVLCNTIATKAGLDKEDSIGLESKYDQLVRSEAEFEMSVWTKLIELETKLKSKSQKSAKKRQKIEKQADKLRSKLGLLEDSAVQHASNMFSNNGLDDSTLDSAQEKELLRKWQELRKSSGRREMTSDRVVLAEGLRRDLERVSESYSDSDAGDSMYPSEMHVIYASTFRGAIPNPEHLETLTIDLNENRGRCNHSSDVHLASLSGGKMPVTQTTTPRPNMIQSKEVVHELLLAIKLGLRCGAALFDDTGRLLRHEQILFRNLEDLCERVPQLLHRWEDDANSCIAQISEETSKTFSLSYLAIEGGGDILDAWEFSIDKIGKKDIQLVNVRPEEWRTYLLTQKERRTKQSCTEATQLLARQLVAEFGMMGNHKGKLKTESAESVAMGFYMVRNLGWIQREPLVSRYNNGKIMVPN